VDLEPTFFGIEPNMAVLHQVIKANSPPSARHAVDQDAQRGSRWRPEALQPEGTGGARQAPSARRSTGGGIALGPKPRKYDQKTPKKMIRLALYSALSDRASMERVAVVDSFAKWETPKTKDAITALGALGLDGKILVVLGSDDATALRSFRNLMNVKTIDKGEVNAYDVLDCDWILFTDETLPSLKENN